MVYGLSGYERNHLLPVVTGGALDLGSQKQEEDKTLLVCIFVQRIIQRQKVMEREVWLELVIDFHMMKACGSNTGLGVVTKEQTVLFRTSSFEILSVLSNAVHGKCDFTISSVI